MTAEHMDTEQGQPPQISPVIRTPDQRVRVFVSSTLEELAGDRQAAREAITHLRLTPVLFELGARPHPPRPLYRAYLEQSDVFVGIYWQRYGWVAPGEEISGLEDEYSLAGDRPKLIYVKQPAPERESRLTALLDRIMSDDTACYKPFHDSDELRELMEDDLAVLLTESFARTQAPAEHAPRAPVHDNLPLPRSPLVDRASEVAMARELLLRDDVGLVTFTGPGGSGKTRLALHVAAGLRDAFANGVCFVSLASLADPDLIASAIAEALSIHEAPGRSLLETLTDYLRAKHLLLVLDNFEHLLSTAPMVAGWLGSCRQLTILVTSRSPLRVRDEKELYVPPLAVPDPTTLPEPAILSRYAAVELFVQRAQAVRPDFALTGEEARDVAEICRRVDGLPLAIELAAAHTRLFAPRALLQRLEHRLPLLTGGAQDLPARQRTLHAAIAWSYDLLSQEERQLFRSLAVFAGGFTLDAAADICAGALGEPSAAAEPLASDDHLMSVIESLVNKSLLRVEESVAGEPHFGMLETIREFARDELTASGEEAELLARHARWFLRLATTAAPFLTTGDRAEWMTRLSAEQSNLRDALRWALGDGNGPEIGVRLADALSWFWFLRGQTSEGRGWLQRAVAIDMSRTMERERASVLQAIGAFAWAQGDYDEAISLEEESAAAYTRLGVAGARGKALLVLGMALEGTGNSDAALKALQDSLALLAHLGDRWWEALNLYHMGNSLLHMGQVARALSCYQEGFAMYERLNDSWGQGLLEFAQGDLARERARAILSRQHGPQQPDALRAFLKSCAVAYEHFRASRDLMSEVGEKYSLARALTAMADTALHFADPEEVENEWLASLALWWELGNTAYILVALTGLAQAAVLEGQRERAAALFGVVDGHLVAMEPEQRGVVSWAYAEIRHGDLDENLRAAHDDCHEARLQAAWESGRRTNLERAVSEALKAHGAST